MSHGSLWQEPSLAVGEVPTLRKLLRCCDERLLVRTIIEEHAEGALGTRPLTGKRRRVAEKRLSAALSTMRRLPLGAKGGPPRFLLPQESFVLHASSGLVERRMSALLVSLDDVELAHRLVSDRGGEKRPAAEPEDEEEAVRRSYTLAPWEDVLAYRVWLGGPWCTRERYLVLASAFWEMTYLGFEYDRVCARRAREKARLLLEGGEAPAPGGASASGRVVLAAEERQVRRAKEYGLDEPDRFALDYRDRLASRVAELNRACRRDVWARLLDLARRLE